jgi:hypothetical protein
MSEDKTIRKALEIIVQYGDIEGSHHKQWVLDQVVRTLCRTEEVYEKWLQNFKYWDEDEYKSE